MNEDKLGNAPGGYPRELLKDKSDLTERIICGVCNLILRDVVQHECGHRFCSPCAQKLQSDPQPQFCPRCPRDSQEAYIRKIYPDFAGRKEIRLLKVKCLNSSCPFEGNLNEYITNHQNICPHAKVPCTACDRQMKLVELQNHRLRDCTERTITCRWCNAELVHKTMKQHNSVCPKLEILCEICKKSKLPREEMKLHQDPENGDCPRRKRCCKFRMVGCEFTAPQEQMPGHLKNNVQEHLNLMMGDYIIVKKQLEAAHEKLKDYQSMDMTDSGKSNSSVDSDEIVQKVVKELKRNEGKLEFNGVPKSKDDVEVDAFKSIDINPGGAKNGARRKIINTNQGSILKEGKTDTGVGSTNEITELKTIINLNSQKIKSLQLNQGVLAKKNEVFHDVIDVLNTEMDKTGQKIVETLQEVEQLKVSERETEKHLKAVEQASALKDVTITEHFLQIQSLENTAYGGILLWKITNFSQKRRDAISGKQTSLYSPYFFTSRYGYRVCCRIYLNGDGMGRGTHISIFFVIMKGKYDALLQWPFRQKVNFVLLDQNNREHVVDGFRPDDKSSSFRRPTTDMNIASGCPLFISMAELEASPNAYIKDDTMFVKVIVDMSEVKSSHHGGGQF
ncbi:TNF receptor-associated factor 2-like isoform X1 [Anneissia japonica]|uniref:TNF receptor-associated factor 2-like isoform X1 n=1 Tax=Anneissia japonica TaxID=1529436 RepID=UPI0014254F07|nr:TNF receptor-associated factor 2-like isoform X1 [Anneissia japonica]XP_033103368.1 TNF receptor-associated factor 2-like isoform X1 [Anneissia japonica]